MARLRSALRAPAAPAVDFAQRWEDTKWLFGAHEPHTPAAEVYAAVAAERRRIARLDLAAAERLAALDDFLATHGWLDSAHQQLDHIGGTT